MKERIIAVAMRIGLQVFTLPPPARHADVIRALNKQGVNASRKNKQGFLTNTGRFVGREEGAHIANNAGQVISLIPPRILTSEDLW